MTKYIIRRLLQGILVFFSATILSYVIISFAPGGPVGVLAFNQRLKPREVEELKIKLGVNDPLPVQYLRWLLGDDWMRWDSDGDGLADGSVFFIDLFGPELDKRGKPLIDESAGGGGALSCVVCHPATAMASCVTTLAIPFFTSARLLRCLLSVCRQLWS